MIEFVKRKISKYKNQIKKKELKKEKEYAAKADPSEYEKLLSKWFYDEMGYYPDLKHPQTFNEKIQWLKLNDSTPQKTRLADKYLVREYIREKIGESYLIPLLGVYDSFDEIDIEGLPKRFVMKANHGCHYNIVVEDKDDFDVEKARKKFNRWLSTNYAFSNGFELHYKDIPPKIVVEENISEEGKTLIDYKFWCNKGKVVYIFSIIGRETDHPTMAFFDKEWNLLPFINSTAYGRCTEKVEKPEHLDEMIEVAEKLSEGFYFVRVDLYDTPKGIRFGEMTFTPSSGVMKFNPPEYSRICGDLIKLPCDE